MPEFFLLDEVAHHQGWNFVKKRLQGRCFTVNFGKFLKAPSRTPPVNASVVNATFLILRPFILTFIEVVEIKTVCSKHSLTLRLCYSFLVA